VALYAVGFLGSSLHNLSGFLPTLTYLSYMSIMILGLYTAMGTVRGSRDSGRCCCVFARASVQLAQSVAAAIFAAVACGA
jgi:hypothetical protein